MNSKIKHIVFALGISTFFSNIVSAVSTNLCEKLYGAAPLEEGQLRKLFESGNNRNVSRVGAQSDVKFFLNQEGEIVRVDFRVLDLNEPKN